MYWLFCFCFLVNFLVRILSCWVWWDGGEKERFELTFIGDFILLLVVVVVSSLRDSVFSSRFKLLFKGLLEFGELSLYKEDTLGER